MDKDTGSGHIDSGWAACFFSFLFLNLAVNIAEGSKSFLSLLL